MGGLPCYKEIVCNEGAQSQLRIIDRLLAANNNYISANLATSLNAWLGKVEEEGKKFVEKMKVMFEEGK